MPNQYLAASYIVFPVLFFFLYPKLIRFIIAKLPFTEHFNEEKVFDSLIPLRFFAFPLYFAYLLKVIELNLRGDDLGMTMIWLRIGVKINLTLFVIVITLFLYRVLYQGSKVFMLAIHRPLTGEGSFLGAFVFVLRVILLLISAAVTVTIWGVNVGNILTGLGLSSLAIAFAAQDTFSNLFGGATVHMDRPFTKGEFITIESYSGIVEKIGFRSTHIRTLDERIIVVPNSKLITGFLINESRMRQRRINVEFKINSNFTKKQMENFRQDLQKLIAKRDLAVEEAQIFLLGADDTGIILTIRYYIKTTDFDEWLQERSLLIEDVLELLSVEKIQLRFRSNEPK